jgi:hypothetical protein
MAKTNKNTAPKAANAAKAAKATKAAQAPKAGKASKATLAAVPKDATFVNTTELTNKLLIAGCAMATPSLLRLGYVAAGIAIGIAAIIARFTVHINNLTLVLVLLMGLMIVWQGNRLPMEAARKLSLELDRAGEGARTRTCYASDQGFGYITPAGQAHTLPWSAFSGYKGNAQVILLTLGEGRGIFTLDTSGFSKGQAGDFVALLHQHIPVKEQSKLEKWADTACYTLDNWNRLKKAGK